MPFVPIETDRLRLRAIHAGDVDRLVDYRNDAHTARMQGWPVPFSREDAERIVTDLHDDRPGRIGEWFLFAVADRGTDRLLGDVALLTSSPTTGSIGYTMHPDSRGRGIAIESVRLVTRFVFNKLGFESVSADTLSDNIASLRVLSQTGFVRAATRAGRIGDLSTPGHDVWELDYTCTPASVERPQPVLGLLTGGQSTRMGRDKATIELAGKSMASWVVEAGAKAGLDTVVLGPHDAGTACQAIPDVVDDQSPPGPLRGLTAALVAHPGRPVILAATDQPFVQPSTLLQLALQPDADVVVAIDEGYPQVTSARYGPRIAELLRATPVFRLRDTIELGRSRIIQPEVWQRWGEDGRSFRSLDRPEDVEEALINFGPPSQTN